MQTILKNTINTEEVKLKYQAPIVMVFTTENKTQGDYGFGHDGAGNTEYSRS